MPQSNSILAASAVIHDESRRILLVQRANPPDVGCWTLPGGRVDGIPIFGMRQETAIHQLFRQNEALLTDSLR